MPSKQEVSSFKRLKDHISRIEKDPKADKEVLKRLKMKLKAMGPKTGIAERMIENLQKRNNVLSKLKVYE